MELEVFSSVWFLPIKNNRTKKKPNRNRSKPTGFRLVSVWFLMPKTEKTYMLFLGFIRLCNELYDGLLIDL